MLSVEARPLWQPPVQLLRPPVGQGTLESFLSRCLSAVPSFRSHLRDSFTCEVDAGGFFNALLLELPELRAPMMRCLLRCRTSWSPSCSPSPSSCTSPATSRGRMAACRQMGISTPTPLVVKNLRIRHSSTSCLLLGVRISTRGRRSLTVPHPLPPSRGK